MKKLLRFLKYCFYTIIAIVILGLATIYVGHKFIFPIPNSDTATLPEIQKDGFCLGIQCQPKARTVETFLPVFANQIKNYSKIAPTLWPDNKVVNLYAAVQSIETGKSWLISPKGKISSLTTQQLNNLCPVRSQYNIGFNTFKNDSIQGVYLALSEEALKNVLEYQKYQYLGTYDLLLTYNHEMFHKLEQDSVWKEPKTINNRGRDPRLNYFDARVERNMIYHLLLKAVASTDTAQRDSLILQGIANYKYYKEAFPDDYKAAQYFDRIEGTAHYYEMVSTLYSAYPQQINDKEKLRKALQLLAQSNNPKPYDEPGLINESYVIGAWTGILLDEVQEDNNQWKNRIMQDPNVTPLDILTDLYIGENLPAPVKPTTAIQEKVKKRIEEIKNKKVAPGIFRMLYQMIFE